jgi:hypothetical protein
MPISRRDAFRLLHPAQAYEQISYGNQSAKPIAVRQVNPAE